MGFRFRKRVKLLPGLYWNIGGKKSSFSVKMGPVTKNFSSRGTKTTVSARGSGMSYSAFEPKRGRDVRQALPPPVLVEETQGQKALRRFVTVVFASFVGVVALWVVLICIIDNFSHPDSAPPGAISNSQPRPVNVPVAPPSPSPTPEPLPAPETAKNSFTLDGKKITGVTSAFPSPGGKVFIIFDAGGITVPASSLPQAFLDAWKITPQSLEIMGP